MHMLSCASCACACWIHMPCVSIIICSAAPDATPSTSHLYSFSPHAGTMPPRPSQVGNNNIDQAGILQSLSPETDRAICEVLLNSTCREEGMSDAGVTIVKPVGLCRSLVGRASMYHCLEAHTHTKARARAPARLAPFAIIRALHALALARLAANERARPPPPACPSFISPAARRAAARRSAPQ